jgi:hypothetical protein
MKKTFQSAVVILTFVVSATANAATVFINLTCAEYVEGTAISPASHPYNWLVSGYLTGTNMVRDRTSPADGASYRVWLADYCRQHPFEPFMSALDKLDRYLGEGKNTVIPAGKKSQ